MSGQLVQTESQLIAKALELPANLSTKALVIGERILVGRKTLSNLVKVTPDWLNGSDVIIPENGALPHAS